MILLSIFTFILTVSLWFFDKKKTIRGLKKGLTLLLNLFFPFVSLLFLVSFVFSLFPQEKIIEFLGKDSGLKGYGIAALTGSIAMIPGFIAFPLGSVLVKMGVGYGVLAVFMTTLMMVGTVTLKIEASFFGWKVSLLRNCLSLMGSLIIGMIMAVLWEYL
ncbi:MAG TPA: permease [Spirochaetia bacterium]|nr:MAG: hypothetical protein A2Y41_00695 [Spirochaetes bacterium GWB1_36_13]HCL55942.1 permease [Spirochaetia bacterium]